MLPPGPPLSPVSTTVSIAAAAPGASRTIFLIGAPRCGVETVLRGLGAAECCQIVLAPGLFGAGIRPLLDSYQAPPMPGLNRLTTLAQLAVATRRLADDIVAALAGRSCSPDNGLRQIALYGSDLVYNVDAIRMLFPDAAIIHVVRNISSILRGTDLTLSRTAISAYQVCAEWRSIQRSVHGAPPWPMQFTMQFESLTMDPDAAASALRQRAGIRMTGDHRAAFCASILAASPGSDAARSAGLLARWARWSAGIYCQAELATAGYQDSLGRPGRFRRLLAAASLRTLHIAPPTSPRPC